MRAPRSLGWLDYALPHWYYVGLTLLLMLNVAAWIRRGRTAVDTAQGPRTTLVWSFALVYAVAITTSMWWQLPGAAQMLQGRYFLPCVAAMGLWLEHDRTWLRRLLFAWLALMNVAFVDATVARYYADGWSGLWAALPW